MALYTILFGISLFMIALVMAIIKKMFFHWKEEHKSERTCVSAVERPAVSVIIYAEKCLMRRRNFGNFSFCDILSKSDLDLDKMAHCDVTMQLQKPRSKVVDEQPINLCLGKEEITTTL